MRNRIENKVHAIADVLFRDMENGRTEREGIGLLAGRMGVIIFCKHYLRSWPDPAKEKIMELYVDSFFEQLVSGVNSFTYCSGLAGVLEGLKYLNEEKLLEVDYSDIEENYRKHLYQFALLNIGQRNYDYLHGGLGVVKYFRNDAEFVNKALEALEKTAIADGKKYKWVSKLGADERYGYNISLSHGSSSIVCVLSTLTSEGIDPHRRDRIVRNACNYILSQQIAPELYGCFFPSQSLENDPQQEIRRSRLGWCYGDLGIATSLWQAGKLADNRDWQEKALETLAYSARRRDPSDAGIYDAGLCHGAASICMMFHYMYQQTGSKLFGETRDHWLGYALDMGNIEAGLAGYSTWRGEKQVYVNEYAMLEGISGIGLMLLALATNAPEDARWLSFFMLN
ncbi:lanthionine synthetase C family protein [uncultured Alistipes sp.]|jgi:lanthionine synthetase C family protein|uniref:lanthionine synthetase C family protein n=1 Tax=uncultured Alistipes sp. TaxID=538949 RepID=UPI0025EEB4A5|nr:lanthionine synthetase C family protein [uncultured Alistipes sp.]